ncbi:MAG: hypothetical protein LBM96_08085 [Methanobrevibacter sp.]|jgi:hypothetical protein|nr:hypothetical protein [Candidatus Methanoflexus mossambicus]
MVEIMSGDMSEEEDQYNGLAIKLMRAKSDEEIEYIKQEIKDFSKKHPDLVDEIQSRRWLIS